MPLWLESVWHFVFGWPSLAALICAAAIAVAILEPKQLDAITDLRKWAIVVAAVAFGYIAIAGKFYHDGIAEKQRQWDNALASEAVTGEQARSDAESAVRSESPDSVRNDSRNRDLWGKQPEGRAKSSVRWLESHRFFGK